MKNLLLTLSVIGLLFASSGSLFAQKETKAEKQAKKVEKQAAEEKKNIMSIETLNFNFTPLTVEPEFGMQRDINCFTCLVTVDKDYFTAQLPYIGRFYIQPTSPEEVPLQIYSTRFLYSVHTTDGVNFEVLIVPTDTVDILNQGIRFLFKLNKNTGDATLIISAENRQYLTFTGSFNYNN